MHLIFHLRLSDLKKKKKRNLSKKIVGFSFVDIPDVGRGENKKQNKKKLAS